ncbi:hypothetical protein SLEP1_g15405 [Rubroshorea leprosula]|uniref:Uncharacterized protein n=1 Tax=Rubroshorea leprosula TaxID=152421 RepID=A0AAV5IXZ8_9ROSI|nr:hypothetical protein SLEP1_g15405 [Rubroshorea leprosula]
MQADQQQQHHHQPQHEAWNLTIQARARRMFDFTVKARIIPTTGKFQSFSILLWLHSFDFRFNLESVPAIPSQRETLKSRLLKFFERIRICSWKKKTSAPKKDVIPANPLTKPAFKKTEEISPCWLVLTGGCLAAAVCWATFHQGNYMKFESASISRYVSAAFKFASEILYKWIKW